MGSYSFSDHRFEAFSSGGFALNGGLRGGSSSSSSSSAAAAAAALVLDSQKGELVKAPARVGKKGISEAKALAALKNHSEAERRRRERINAHLSTLRGLVPCKDKMDKATLLAEVIRQVKELKKNAAEASRGLLIPMDADQVLVEPYDNNGTFKATLCCAYRPELLSDVGQALEALPVKMVRTEISTLGDRLKILFVFTYCKEKNISGDPEICRSLASSVQETLSSVLDKASALAEYSPRTTLTGKRQRFSYFDSSSSSS